MLKGAKTHLRGFEDKKILIMPSTRNFSAVVNNALMMVFIGLVLMSCYGIGFYTLAFGPWQTGVYWIASTFMWARLFDLLTVKKGRRGRIMVGRGMAKDLIDAEAAYALMSELDQAIYKNFLEGAYCGEATPKKVTKLFKSKCESDNPKVLDDLIDLET